MVCSGALSVNQGPWPAATLPWRWGWGPGPKAGCPAVGGLEGDGQQGDAAGVCRWRGAGRSGWRPCLPGSCAWGHLPGSPVSGVWTGQLRRPDLRGGWRWGGGWRGWKCPAWMWHPHVSGRHILGSSLGFSPAQLGDGGPPRVVDAGGPAHGRPCSVMTPEDKADDPSHGPGQSVLQTRSRS